MSSFSDAIDTGFAGLQAAMPTSVSYTPSGGSASSITGVWTPEDSNSQYGEYREDVVRRGELQISTADVSTVTEEEDTAEIDSVTYIVTGAAKHAGLWTLQLEAQDYTRSYVGNRRLD